MSRAKRVAAVPAYQAAKTVGAIVAGLRPRFDEVWVLDDGSTDGTGEAAAKAGARVLRHPVNLGKGAALRALLATAKGEGVDAIVTVDADGQHDPEEAERLDRGVPDRTALVLGVRDLVGAGAPKANRRGNSISNYWLRLFSGRDLSDTNCGLRRYPVTPVLALGGRGERFSWEAEVVLRAALFGVRIVEFPVAVAYPEDRTSHFDVVRDPARIIRRVVGTVFLGR